MTEQVSYVPEKHLDNTNFGNIIEDNLAMERVVDEAIEMHALVREVDDNFHGRRRGGEDRDDNFNNHLETVLNTLESRVQAHNGQTVEGELMQRVEVLLASHGIFDAAVVSAIVPLCHEISPQLGQTLSKFRRETANIISELSRCCSQLEQHTSEVKLSRAARNETPQEPEERGLQVLTSSSTSTQPQGAKPVGSFSSKYDPHPISPPPAKPAPRIHPGRYASGGLRGLRRRGTQQTKDFNTYHIRSTKTMRQTRDPIPASDDHTHGRCRPRHDISRSSPSSSSYSPLSTSLFGSPSAESKWGTSPFTSESATREARGLGGLDSWPTSPGMGAKLIEHLQYSHKEELAREDTRNGALEVPMEEESSSGLGVESALVMGTRSDALQRPGFSVTQYRRALRKALSSRKVQAKLLSIRDTSELADAVVSSKRAKDREREDKAKGLRGDEFERGRTSSYLSTRSPNGLEEGENVPVPRVDTMEEHVYKHMLARYRILSLAMEHVAVFLLSVEAWAFGIPVGLSNGAEVREGAPGLFSFGGTAQMHSESNLEKGEPLLRTFFYIFVNLVDEGFYYQQKRLQDSIHGQLLKIIRRVTPFKDQHAQKQMLLKKLCGWLSETEFLNIVNAVFRGHDLGREARAYHHTSKRYGTSSQESDRGLLYEFDAGDDSERLPAMVFLLRCLARAGKEREIEARTNTILLDRNNGSRANSREFLLTYDEGIFRDPGVKEKKSQEATFAVYQEDNKVRTKDFVATILNYQLHEHEKVLAPLSAAFRTVDQANTGAIQARPHLSSLFTEGRLHGSHFVCIPDMRKVALPISADSHTGISATKSRESQGLPGDDASGGPGGTSSTATVEGEDFFRGLLVTADELGAGELTFSRVASALLYMGASQ